MCYNDLQDHEVDFFSENIVSTDGSTVYTFSAYGSSGNFYTYFTAFNLTNGSVIGSRYKSSIYWYIYRSTTTGEYIVLPFIWSSTNYLVIFNTSSFTFTNLAASSGITIFDVKMDQQSGR